eukprot:473525-Karenia_brevis.AAC.1
MYRSGAQLAPDWFGRFMDVKGCFSWPNVATDLACKASGLPSTWLFGMSPCPRAMPKCFRE